MTLSRQLRVFLLYARGDREAVHRLYRRIRKEGANAWLDVENLLPGQDWQCEIRKAIHSSDILIVCLSKRFNKQGGYRHEELRIAVERANSIPGGEIFIVPARLERCELPEPLRHWQCVDLFEEGSFRRLMKSLRTRASQLERATVQVPEVHEPGPNLMPTSETEDREAAAKVEREKVEKARNEESGRKAAEKAARDKAKREAAEKAKRERAERRAAQVAALKESFAKSLNKLRSAISKAIPFLRLVGIISIISILIWVGSWTTSRLASPIPTATAMLSPSATITFINSPVPSTRTPAPSVTSTSTETPFPTLNSFVASESDIVGKWRYHLIDRVLGFTFYIINVTFHEDGTYTWGSNDIRGEWTLEGNRIDFGCRGTVSNKNFMEGGSGPECWYAEKLY